MGRYKLEQIARDARAAAALSLSTFLCQKKINPCLAPKLTLFRPELRIGRAARDLLEVLEAVSRDHKRQGGSGELIGSYEQIAEMAAAYALLLSVAAVRYRMGLLRAAGLIDIVDHWQMRTEGWAEFQGRVKGKTRQVANLFVLRSTPDRICLDQRSKNKTARARVEPVDNSDIIHNVAIIKSDPPVPQRNVFSAVASVSEEAKAASRRAAPRFATMAELDAAVEATYACGERLFATLEELEVALAMLPAEPPQCPGLSPTPRPAPSKPTKPPPGQRKTVISKNGLWQKEWIHLPTLRLVRRIAKQKGLKLADYLEQVRHHARDERNALAFRRFESNYLQSGGVFTDRPTIFSWATKRRAKQRMNKASSNADAVIWRFDWLPFKFRRKLREDCCITGHEFEVLFHLMVLFAFDRGSPK